MTAQVEAITPGRYSHDVLLHDNDAQLVAGMKPFVELGLASGGQVLVHSTEARVTMLREVLGTHPRLTYGLDCELYHAPSSTLFAYQRVFEDSPEPLEMWATGTVPLGDTETEHAAWGRYESAVNEVLRPYAFHGLCSYDTQVLPPHVIAAAKASHPHVTAGTERWMSHEYAEPAAFLVDPLAAVPGAPVGEPDVAVEVSCVSELPGVRRLLSRFALPDGVSRLAAEGLVAATHEALANALQHGALPVRVELWAGPARLTCRVTDHGRGVPDHLAGYRHPRRGGSTGLWAARQLCENVFIGDLPGGGASVLLSTA